MDPLLKKIKSYCAVLGLTDIPTKKELEQAKRKQMKKYHPDLWESKGKALKEKANKQSKKINEAFDFLFKIDLSQYSFKSKEPSSKSYTWSPRTKKREQPPKHREPTSEKSKEPHYSETPKTGFPDPNVYEIFLESNYAPSVGYNKKTKTLYIRYLWGAVAKFLNVPEAIFEELMDIFSKGYFIRHMIEGKYKSEACYAPFYPYKGGKKELAYEKIKMQERASRRVKRNNEIVKLIEFLFSNPSTTAIETFINNTTFPKNHKDQLMSFANPSIGWEINKGWQCGHLHKEWNHIIKQVPKLFKEVTLTLKKERKHGVVNRKGEITLYFDKSNVIEIIKNGEWLPDGRWLHKRT